MTARRLERIEDAESALLGAFEGLQASLWTALPAVIAKVDLAKMTVEAKPSVQVRVRNPDQTYRWLEVPVAVDVPLVFPSGGGYTLTFPVAVGDECLLVFASRCIDSWWQQGGCPVPAEIRMHDLSDGFALVGPRSQPRVLSGVSTSDVVLRNDAGTTKLSIKANGNIDLTSAANVTMAASQVNITADVNITGNVVISGTLQAGGKNVGGTHTHTPVDTGLGHTGAPT